MKVVRAHASALVAVVVALGVVAATPRRAAACASCGCGDPTLTATGVERPYRNRVRVAWEERYGSLTMGDDLTGQQAQLFAAIDRQHACGLCCNRTAELLRALDNPLLQRGAAWQCKLTHFAVLLGGLHQRVAGFQGVVDQHDQDGRLRQVG